MSTGEQPILPSIYNIDSIINKYKKIPIGEYNNDKINVKIELRNKEIKRIEINSDDYYFLIRLFEFGYDLVYKNNDDIKSMNNMNAFNIVKSLGCSKKYINTTFNDKTYIIYKEFIRVNGEDLKISNKTIRKNINNKYFLEYDLSDNLVYLYIAKKENAQFKNVDYIKLEFTKELYDIINMINNTFENDYEALYNNIQSTNYGNLTELLNYKKIKCDFENEITELINAVNIYLKYKDKFNIDDNALKEIYDFATYLIENPTEARVNKLENYILCCDMNDSRELKYLKKEINTILKEKKKIKTKKLSNN